MSRYIYTCKVVPLNTPVRIPFLVADGRPAEPVTFDDQSFELERTAKTKPPVCLNHDKDLQIGRIVQLFRDQDGAWLCAHFALDPDVPDDVEFEVGQPVSVGLSNLKYGTYLREVSIVRRGAVKGAEITRRFALDPKPAEAPRAPAAVVSSSKPTAVGEVIPIRRAPRSRPTAFPRSEFERRMDFAIDLAENFGIRGAVEAELEHMQRLERAMQNGRLEANVGALLGVR